MRLDEGPCEWMLISKYNLPAFIAAHLQRSFSMSSGIRFLLSKVREIYPGTRFIDTFTCSICLP